LIIHKIIMEYYHVTGHVFDQYESSENRENGTFWQISC